MALSWTKNISFLVLNVRATRSRRKGREKRIREGERRKKEDEKEKESQGMETLCKDTCLEVWNISLV